MKIKDASKQATRIKHVGEKAKQIGLEEVAQALGAEPAHEVAPTGGSPVARFTLHQELVQRLRSTDENEQRGGGVIWTITR